MLHLRQTEPELWIFVDTFGLHLAPALASRDLAATTQVTFGSFLVMLGLGAAHVPNDVF